MHTQKLYEKYNKTIKIRVVNRRTLQLARLLEIEITTTFQGKLCGFFKIFCVEIKVFFFICKSFITIL